MKFRKHQSHYHKTGKLRCLQQGLDCDLTELKESKFTFRLGCGGEDTCLQALVTKLKVMPGVIGVNNGGSELVISCYSNNKWAVALSKVVTSYCPGSMLSRVIL